MAFNLKNKVPRHLMALKKNNVPRNLMAVGRLSKEFSSEF